MTETRGAEVPRNKLGLAARLAIVISIAMLPLGLISVYQTSRVLAEKRVASDAALLERTRHTAAGSRALIRSAVNSAEALAAAAIVLHFEGTACDDLFAEVVRADEDFIFAGFVDSDLQLICASNGERRDLSGLAGLSQELSSPEVEIHVRQRDMFGGGEAVLSVSVPVWKEDTFFGATHIAIPVGVANDMLADSSKADLVIFDLEGDIIATEDLSAAQRKTLPMNFTLAELAERGRDVFRDVNKHGKTRDFAIVPILDQRIFVLGSWDPDHSGGFLTVSADKLSLFFPLLMWITALAVAYVGVHRLVIRHVKRLGRWMLQYSAGRKNFDRENLEHAPQELETVAAAFKTMADRLTKHEKRREEDLEEISTLFKEVHHRVKNNLQLIISIMNMQIRTIHNEEAKNLMRRVQDRVMALSEIHRYLYMARKLSLVQADELLEEIIRKLVVVGQIEGVGRQISFSTSFDPVVINPDQSVPLTLLATEAAMNAVKYCGTDASGDAWINVALKLREDDQVVLSVVNSTDGVQGAAISQGVDGSGLGSKLIESFASQLDGKLDVSRFANRFELHVVFTLMDTPDEDEN